MYKNTYPGNSHQQLQRERIQTAPEQGNGRAHHQSSQSQPVPQGGAEPRQWSNQPRGHDAPQTRQQGGAGQQPGHTNQHEMPAHSPSPEGKYPRNFGINVYGAKAALNFVPDSTRKDFKTVSIEGALTSGRNDRTYLWDKKIRIQITRLELLDVIAVLLGIGPNPQFQFSNHGPQNGPKKGFSMEHQGRGVFVKLFEGGKANISVPVPMMEAIQLGHFILSIYMENYPGISSDVVLQSVSKGLQLKYRAEQATAAPTTTQQ